MSQIKTPTSKVCGCGSRYYATDLHDACPCCMAFQDVNHYNVDYKLTKCVDCKALSRSVFYDRRLQFDHYSTTGEWTGIKTIRKLRGLGSPEAQSGPRKHGQSGSGGSVRHGQSSPRTESQSGTKKHGQSGSGGRGKRH